MISAPVVTRPESRIEALARKLSRAMPQGLPAAVEAFYAEGDGLVVTIKHGKRSDTAAIVGLAEMFGDDWKPHKPVAKRPASLDGRPFADRFFSDDFDFDAPDALAQFNVLLRLKLLVSLPGESADIAIDLFAEGEPVLYLIAELTAYRLDLSFADFVAYFCRFGAARWYFAFLEPAADQRMNVDVAKAFAASMKPFDGPAVTRLEKVIARRSKALARKAKEEQQAAEPAPAKGAGKPATKAEVAEIKGDVRGAREALVGWAPEALSRAIAHGQVGPEAAWSYRDGLRVIAPALRTAVLAAKRDVRQDALIWDRVEQLVDVDVSGVTLDPLLRDAALVLARLRGEDVPMPERYARALPGVALTKLTTPATPAEPVEDDAKDRGAWLRAVARYRRDRLLAVGTALVGEQAFREALTRSFRAGDIPAVEALLIIAPALDLSDVERLVDRMSAGALAELIAANRWPAKTLTALAGKLGQRGNAIKLALDLL